MCSSNMKHLKYLLVAIGLFFASQAANAAVGVIYVDCDGSACTGSNGALATNSGTTDTSTPTFTGTVDATNTAGTTITLPTNTNLTGLSTAGDQAINWANATNTNYRIFWITGVTGCTGTGACSLTVSVATTCTTCGAGGYAIGGRYLWPTPSAQNVIEGALRAGDTVQFNTTPASRTAVYLTSRVSGDATTGYITIRGKAGVTPRPLLNVTAAAAIITLSANNNYHLQHLEFRNTSTAGNVAIASESWIDDCIVSHPSGGGTATGVAISGTPFKITNSEFSGWNNAMVSIPVSQVSQGYIFGNWFHDGSSDGVNTVTVNDSLSIINNVFSNLTGSAVNINATGTGGGGIVVNGNTFYNNGIGLQVASANYPVFFSNNPPLAVVFS